MMSKLSCSLAALALAFSFPSAPAARAAVSRPHISVSAGHYNGRLWTSVTNDGNVKITRLKWLVKFVHGPSGQESGVIQRVLKPGQTVSFYSNLPVPTSGHWRADHLILSIYTGGRWIEPD